MAIPQGGAVGGHMAAYVDLGPLPYFGNEHAEYLRAVGWIEHGTSYPVGPTPPAVLERLKQLFAAHPLQPRAGFTAMPRKWRSLW